MLTESADRGAAFTGTKKGDVFEADSFVSGGTYLPTLNLSDELDGGAGKDTLNITSDDTAVAAGYKMADATIKNIETITIKGANHVTADVSGSNITGLETISVLKSVDATVTAAATTDVNVSGAKGTIVVKGGNDVVVTDATAAKAITVGNLAAGGDATGTITITDTDNSGALNTITVEGGTDVTVTTTADKADSGNITIGDSAKGMATGNVVVTQNTTNNATANIKAGDVTVTGGKTVEITANMTNTAVKAGNTGIDIIAGKYTVTADNTTTDVTITQNATATNFENDAAEMVKETSVVTFNEMKATETLNINGLIFTASKDLTAAEVAAAFANLTDKDTQSATGITANGIYTAAFTTGWTSGAANGATVTFTAKDEEETDLTFAGSAATKPTQVKSLGTAAGASTAVTVAEDFGDVVVDDNATKSITTITLDGFDDAILGATAPAATSSLDKLATLNLANSTGTTTLTSTVATLNVNVDGMAGIVDLASNADISTLNLNATGTASKITLKADAVDLTIAAAADLVIATGSALTTLENVTIKGAGAVNLGVIPVATALNSFDASGNTGGVTATIETLSTSVGTITEYVFSAGNDVVTLAETTVNTKITLGAGDDKITLASGTTAIPTAAVNGGADTDTISMTFASADAFNIDTNFAAAISGFERLEINNVYDGGITGSLNSEDILILDLANLGFASYVITSGTLIDTDPGESDILRLTKLAANATVVLTDEGYIEAVLATATGATDVINVIANVAGSDVDFGTFTVAGVETVKITSNDTLEDDDNSGKVDNGEAPVENAELELVATAAKTVTVDGSANLDLTTTTPTNLKTVEASDMTGALTYTISSSVVNFELISGLGADIITVATSNNAQVKTGDGDDKITVEAGAVSANIWGGAGKNTFDVKDTISSAAQYVTIEDAKSGDKILLKTDTFLSGSVSITDFDQIGLSEKFEAVLTDTVLNAAPTNEFAAWFQHTGNTYIVVSDGNGAINFGGATGDQIIKLTGLVDLGNGASFNATALSTTGTLEIA